MTPKNDSLLVWPGRDQSVGGHLAATHSTAWHGAVGPRPTRRGCKDGVATATKRVLQQQQQQNSKEGVATTTNERQQSMQYMSDLCFILNLITQRGCCNSKKEGVAKATKRVLQQQQNAALHSTQQSMLAQPLLNTRSRHRVRCCCCCHVTPSCT